MNKVNAQFFFFWTPRVGLNYFYVLITIETPILTGLNKTGD
jgi:hypothetical protein